MSQDGWSATSIPGVVQRHGRPIADERGLFLEVWRQSWTENLSEHPFVQANLSRSRAGVLRGMHFHLRQADLWIVLEGRALAAVTDLRGLLRKGGGRAHSEEIEMTAGAMLYIPRQVAHGFWALEDLALLYLVTHEYDGSDEYGFSWNDSAAGISWPPGEPVMSARDRANPSLGDVAAGMRQHSSGR